MNCRSCGSQQLQKFADLQTAPPSNAYLEKTGLQSSEIWIPLRVMVCESCFFCQTEDFVTSENVFTSDYAYFSSISKSWLEHSSQYVELAIEKLSLNSESLVMEAASNDGYLLQYFKAKSIPCLGIEPTHSTAAFANSIGIQTLEVFLGSDSSKDIVSEFGNADLVLGNNVLAHVPDIIDFLKGCDSLLKKSGTITFEFPHLMQLLQNSQFDTIYHEHFSYLSLVSLIPLLTKINLEIYRVEELQTHGGSLRIWIKKTSNGEISIEPTVAQMLAKEIEFGLKNLGTYMQFQSKITTIRNNLLKFLIDAQEEGKKVIGYGAAAKGNTLLNFAGVKNDLLTAIVDQNPAKIGKFSPGSRIPIVDIEIIEQIRPDYILVLPWNLVDEISELLKFTRQWECKLVRAIPDLEIS